MTEKTNSGMLMLAIPYIFLKEPTHVISVLHPPPPPPHLYSSPVFRGWWGTDSSWEQQPRKQTQGSLPVLHVRGSEGRLGTVDHPVSFVVLGRNHANCENYLQEFLLSFFHDLVFNQLEHHVFPSLLFRPSSHSSRKAVTNEKIQVGSRFNDL